MLQPAFEQIAVHGTAESKWRDHFTATYGGDNARSSVVPAAHYTDHLFSARSIAVLTRVVLVEAAFINKI
jgi:hypothetical protein